MSIALANVRTGTVLETAAAGTTAAVAYPTVVKSDDVLVLYISVFNTTTTPTNPGGWTSVDSRGTNSGTQAPWHLMTIKKAAGTETGTLSVTIPNNAVWAQIIAVPDCDLITIQDITATFIDANATSSSCNIAAGTTVTDKVCIVAGASNVSSANTWTPPTVNSVSFTEAGDAGAGFRSSEMSFGLAGAAGSTGTITATSSGTGKSIGAAVFLRPGPPRFGTMMCA